MGMMGLATWHSLGLMEHLEYSSSVSMMYSELLFEMPMYVPSSSGKKVLLLT